MVNVNRLKARMVEAGMNADAVAEKMGLSVSTLYRRFQNPDELTVREVGKMAEILSLNSVDAQSIFFNL